MIRLATNPPISLVLRTARIRVGLGEAAVESNASGGLVAWRAHLQAWFQSYNELANGVQHLLGVELPTLDLENLRNVPNERPRVVTPP